MVNRWTNAVAVNALRSVRELNEAGDSDEYTATDQKHPLCPVGLLINSTTDEHAIRWPELTVSTSWLKYRSIRSCDSATVLRPVLGNEIMARNRGRSAQFTWTCTTTSVGIGMWRFSAGDREDRDKTRTSVASWFVAPLNKVTLAVEGLNFTDLECTTHGTSWHEAHTDLVYGRVHYFVEIRIPGFHEADQVHRLARCSLYFAGASHPVSKVASFSTNDPVRIPWKHMEGDKRRAVTHIRLDAIETQIAVTPKVTGLKVIGSAGPQGVIAHSKFAHWAMPMYK